MYVNLLSCLRLIRISSFTALHTEFFFCGGGITAHDSLATSYTHDTCDAKLTVYMGATKIHYYLYSCHDVILLY